MAFKSTEPTVTKRMVPASARSFRSPYSCRGNSTLTASISPEISPRINNADGTYPVLGTAIGKHRRYPVVTMSVEHMLDKIMMGNDDGLRVAATLCLNSRRQSGTEKPRVSNQYSVPIGAAHGHPWLKTAALSPVDRSKLTVLLERSEIWL